jgi:uncharacterized repeat protein (TIGR01451 family)
MKLFKRFSTRSKILFATALAIVGVAVVTVPTLTHAALGSDRQVKAYTQGVAGFDHVQFNSFTGVPTYGDEREFFTGKISSSTGGYYDSLNGVASGNEMLVRVYVHNNADSSLNANGTGVAKNTRVRVALPTGLAATQTASAFVSADNAQPKIIEDTFSVTGQSPVGLAYVPGSANIKTNMQDKALSDDIIGANGVLIGDDNVNGNMRGCFEYVALITFKVKVTAPSYTLQKGVRAHGTTTFGEEASVKSGDQVDFSLGFKNTGGTNLNNVVLGDRLPVGLTYVPGTSEWLSGHTNGQWTKITNDDWMKGGLNVGAYAPNSNVFIRFTAKVDDASKLECGLNQLVNHGFAKPEGQSTIEDAATVKVTRECATPTPVYSCDLLEITRDDASRTVTVSAFTQTSKDGASFKTVDLNWGENGAQVLTTNTPVGQKHTYTGNGPFTVTATAKFAVQGKDDQTATSASCAKTVSFTTPVTPVATTTPQTPAVLPNTGVGNIFGLFALVATAGALFHRLFLSRRLAR